MGELIRSIDWSATPLGQPDTWPLSLKHAVAMMLASKFPILICWGDEFTQLYNDSFRPINGSTKHPGAMGGSAADTYAEIWDATGAMFRDVMQGQTFALTDYMVPLNRNGFVEDCYFDFSYSPIRDEFGFIGGIIVICVETTDKLKAISNLTNINSSQGKLTDDFKLINDGAVRHDSSNSRSHRRSEIPAPGL